MPLLWAFAVGAVFPFAMLLIERVRRSPRLTALAALFVLGGLALHEVWLLAPSPRAASASSSAGLRCLRSERCLLGAIWRSGAALDTKGAAHG